MYYIRSLSGMVCTVAYHLDPLAPADHLALIRSLCRNILLVGFVALLERYT